MGREELVERELFEVAKKSIVVCLLLAPYKSGWGKSKVEESVEMNDLG